MRFMVIIKSNERTEGPVMPSEQMFAEMGAYNEELAKAGVMLSAEGLLPSSRGARVAFDGTKRSVIDGPFAEAKELIAGFWIIKTESLAEAVEWVKKIPNTDGGQSEVEIRQVGELEDMGDTFTPELREQEERVRDLAEQNQ